MNDSNLVPCDGRERALFNESRRAFVAIPVPRISMLSVVVEELIRKKLREAARWPPSLERPQS